jgi:pimeloyl-ACP methyl ester carboxylesterase
MQILLLVFVVLVSVLALLLALVHVGFRAPRIKESRTPADWGMPFSTESIETVGGKRLFAWHVTGDMQAPTLVLIHGWGANAQLMLPLAAPFYRAGMNVLLLDSRLHGQSDGDTFSSMPRFAEDLASALEWLKQQADDKPGKFVLMGHSVGAAAALLAASRREDVAAVIGVAGFAHPQWMMQRYLKAMKMPGLVAAGVIRYVQWVIGHRFDDIAPINTICRVRCPVLLVHGEADRTVPASDTQAVFDACADERVRLLLVEGADHDSVEKVEQHGVDLLNFLRDVAVLPR